MKMGKWLLLTLLLLLSSSYQINHANISDDSLSSFKDVPADLVDTKLETANSDMSTKSIQQQSESDVDLAHLPHQPLLTKSPTLFSMIHETPKADLAQKNITFVLTFEDRKHLEQPKLLTFSPASLEVSPIAFVASPLSQYTELMKLDGLVSIEADAYQQFVSSDWSPATTQTQHSNTDTSPFLDSSIQDLHSQGYDGTGITIAVLDTGIDSQHPDLDDLDNDPVTDDPKIIMERSFVDFDLDGIVDTGTQDIFGHGTHVAGILAANGNIKGVAPGASLLNVKVLNHEGSGLWQNILEGFDWAITQGVDVISISIGTASAGLLPALNTAINTAVENGIFVVIAAGNSGEYDGKIANLAAASNALVVGASDKYGYPAAFSSHSSTLMGSSKPDIFAAGVDILSTMPTGRYEYQSGTSMSTPVVSGAIALLLDAYPSSTLSEVVNALVQSADEIHQHNTKLTAGLLNVGAAFDLLGGSVPDYAFPSYSLSNPLYTSSNEKMRYSLNIFVDSSINPVVELQDLSGVTADPMIHVKDGWYRTWINISMTSVQQNGKINIKDQSNNLLYQSDLVVSTVIDQNDADSGTDAGETLFGALPISTNTTYKGDLPGSSLDDDSSDIYSFYVTSSTSYRLLLTRTNGNFGFAVLTSDGGVVVESLNLDFKPTNITFTTIQSGTYYIVVMANGWQGSYQIEIEELPQQVSNTTTESMKIHSLSDYGLDQDNNGLFEAIIIEFQVYVTYDGYYQYFYSISQSRADYSIDKYIVDERWDRKRLSKGLNTLIIALDGEALAASGYSGAYMVNKFFLFRNYYYGFPNDETQPNRILQFSSYETQSYTVDDFEVPIIQYLSYTTENIQLDTSGNPEIMSFTFTFSFSEPVGYFAFSMIFDDGYRINNDNSYEEHWHYDAGSVAAGTHEFTVDIYPYHLFKGDDLVFRSLHLAEFFTPIPIFDIFSKDDLILFDPVYEISFSDRVDYDSIVLETIVRSKIDSYLSINVNNIYSVTNQSSHDAYGWEGIEVHDEITQIFAMNIPISRIINAGFEGNFLFPSIEIHFDRFNHDYQSYLTSYYTSDDFDMEPIELVDYEISREVEGLHEEYFYLTMTLNSYHSGIRYAHIYVSVGDYYSVSGRSIGEWYSEEHFLVPGINTIRIRILEFWRIVDENFIGDAEIKYLSIEDNDGWGNGLIKENFGLLKDIDYRDYLGGLSGYIDQVTLSLVESNGDGKYDAVTVDVDYTINQQTDFWMHIRIVNLLDYSGDLYRDYSSGEINSGSYGMTFEFTVEDIADQIRLGPLIAYVDMGFNNNDFDQRSNVVNLDIKDIIYAPKVELVTSEITFSDVNTDGKDDNVVFDFDFNINTTGYVNIDADIGVEVIQVDNHDGFRVNSRRFWVNIAQGYFSVGHELSELEFEMYPMLRNFNLGQLQSVVSLRFYVEDIRVDIDWSYYPMASDERLILTDFMSLQQFDVKDTITYADSWDYILIDSDNNGLYEAVTVLLGVEIMEEDWYSFDIYISTFFNIPSNDDTWENWHGLYLEERYYQPGTYNIEYTFPFVQLSYDYDHIADMGGLEDATFDLVLREVSVNDQYGWMNLARDMNELILNQMSLDLFDFSSALEIINSKTSYEFIDTDGDFNFGDAEADILAITFTFEVRMVIGFYLNLDVYFDINTEDSNSDNDEWGYLYFREYFNQIDYGTEIKFTLELDLDEVFQSKTVHEFWLRIYGHMEAENFGYVGTLEWEDHFTFTQLVTGIVNDQQNSQSTTGRSPGMRVSYSGPYLVIIGLIVAVKLTHSSRKSKF